MKMYRVRTDIYLNLHRVLIVWGVVLLLFPGLSQGEALAEPKALPDTQPASGVYVQVKPEVEVESGRIYLKDVADIKAGSVLKKKIERLKLGLAPKPGRHKTFSKQRMAALIHSQKWIPSDAELDIPERIVIHGACQVITEDRYRKLFCDYVRSRIQTSDFVVGNFNVRGDRPLPPGPVDFRISARTKDPFMGRTNLRVRVYINGRPEDTVTLSAWIERFETVACVKRSMNRGAVLTRSDIYQKRVKTSAIPPHAVRDTDRIVGMRLKRAVNADACLGMNMLEKQRLIEKGRRVQLVAGRGALKVKTVGIAKNNGARGEQIRVENISSGKMVMGRVIDASTVKVLF